MMTSNRTGISFVHVEAAKRLLAELEQQADSAIQALGRDDSAEFFAAVEDRSGLVSQLHHVMAAISRDRDEGVALGHDGDAAIAEIAEAAATALEAHSRLLARTKVERERLAEALARAGRPDSVASQYAAATLPSGRTISVTG